MYLWIGADYVLPGNNEGVAAAAILSAFSKWRGLNMDGVETTVVFEDAEPDDFWDCFNY